MYGSLIAPGDYTNCDFFWSLSLYSTLIENTLSCFSFFIILNIIIFFFFDVLLRNKLSN